MAYRRQPITIPMGADRPVELDTPCTDCETSGVVYSPAWQRWHKRNQAELDRLRDLDPDGDYAVRMTKAAEKAGPEPHEPEEYMCPECEGVGFQITDAGRALLHLHNRHYRKTGV